jgi:hypothetical protein
MSEYAKRVLSEMPIDRDGDENTQLAYLLKRWRRENEASAASAAEMFGVSPRTWEGWEIGRSCSAEAIVRRMLNLVGKEALAMRSEEEYRRTGTL